MPKDAFAQIRTQLGRTDAGRVTRDEYERAARFCKFATHFQQRQQVALDLPKFAFGTVTETGRVEDHCIVLFASSKLALAELRGIFGDPANWPVSESGLLHILTGTIDNVLGSIDVHDF